MRHGRGEHNPVPEPSGRGIAVLIPVLNEGSRITSLLTRLTAMDFAEIIVADGGSTDATVALVGAFPSVSLLIAPRGRGTQIGAAVRASHQPLLLILHADTALPEAAPRLIRETLSSPATVAGCFRVSFDHASAMLKIFAWCSRFETPITTFGDQAYFMTRQACDAIGGVPDWPLLEDVALRRRLKSHGRFVKRTECVVTSARRFQKRGAARAQARNALVLLGYAAGVPIGTLAASYESR